MRASTRTVKRDSARWYHCSPFLGMVCAGYTLRDRLQVIPCGPTAVPRLRKSPMEEGMAHLMTAAFPRCYAAALAPYVAVSLPAHPAASVAAATAVVESSWIIFRRPHPPHAYSRVWMRAPIRTRHWVILYLAGACVRGLTRTCQRDRPRWCHNMPLVGMGCMLYIAGSAAVICCGSTARPLMHESRIWGQSLTRS